MKKRILSAALAMVMVFSLLPAMTTAAQTDGGLCAHHAAHTADCGYAPAADEQPCTMGCAETDGAIVHSEDCGYVPAADEQPCGHVCELCQAHDEPEPTPAPAPELSEAEALTEQIDALPAVDELYELVPGDADPEYAAKMADIQSALEPVAGIQAEYDALSPDEQALVGEERAAKLTDLAMLAEMLRGEDESRAVYAAPTGLTVGEIYYFDLSKVTFPGTKNENLPDQDMRYVPFLYAGEISALVFDNMAQTEGYRNNSISAQNRAHSMFFSEYNITREVKWLDLNSYGLIYAKSHTSGGVDYRMRAPTVTSGHKNGLVSEWAALKNAGVHFKPASATNTWGQEYYGGYAGFDGLNLFNDAHSAGSTHSTWEAGSHPLGYRPVLEIPASVTDFRTIKLDLNGKIFYADSALRLAAAAESGITVPAPPSVLNTGDFIGWNTRRDGTWTPYTDGAEIPAGVDTLYAQWADTREGPQVSIAYGDIVFYNAGSSSDAVAHGNFIPTSDDVGATSVLNKSLTIAEKTANKDFNIGYVPIITSMKVPAFTTYAVDQRFDVSIKRGNSKGSATIMAELFEFGTTDGSGGLTFNTDSKANNSGNSSTYTKSRISSDKENTGASGSYTATVTYANNTSAPQTVYRYFGMMAGVRSAQSNEHKLEAVCTMTNTVTNTETHTHSYTYTASGAVITENCSVCGHSATATISVPSGASLAYSGSPVTPATVAYSSGWAGVALSIIYSNNASVGSATASITVGGQTASVSFAITAATYTVSYNANGGSGAPQGQTKTYGQTLTLSSTTPTRTGYTFAGWNTEANGTGCIAGGEYSANAAATLYAQWTLNAPTVTLTAEPSDGSADYGSSVTLTASPSHALTSGLTYGYEWYKDVSKLEGKAASSLELAEIADSGSYTVKVTANDGTLTSAQATSNAVTVTISAVAPHKHDMSVACGGSSVEFQKLTSTGGTLSDGSYYLDADVTLTKTLTISGTVNLCLNGYKLNANNKTFSAITVPSGATLNLCDCSEGKTGQVTGSKAGDGGGVYVNGGAFNMYGGGITGNNAGSQGGGVYVYSGTFSLYGGSITGNYSQL